MMLFVLFIIFGSVDNPVEAVDTNIKLFKMVDSLFSDL